MKKIIQSMLVACFFLIPKARAQNEIDALRYSMINYGSTARSLAMGNAFGALGADLSVMASNPAGIALFRRSEFSFGTAFNLRSTQSDFLGASTRDSRFNFNFGNFGVVWHWNSKDDNKDWKGWSFGIGYNRLNDFSSRTAAEGTNLNNSLTDSYAEQANGYSASTLQTDFPFDLDLAYQAYLINNITDTITYESVIPRGGEFQRRKTTTKGSQAEWDFSFGTNYNDQIYFGITLGLPVLRYREDLTWEEKDQNNTIITSDSMYDFKSFKYTQRLKTDGVGVNAKLGIIYRPSDAIRFGLAIHTPTAYNLSDNYSTSIVSSVAVNDSPAVSEFHEWNSPELLPFNYKIVTPFKAVGSAAVILGKQGVVSAEYEYTNYNQAYIKDQVIDVDISFSDANSAIKNTYAVSHTLRIGGEYRIDKLRLRLGGTYSTTPFASGYNDNSKTDQSRYSISGGFGFRSEYFYFDAGYAYLHKGSFFKQYSLSNGKEPGIIENMMDHRLMFTIGFNF